MFLKRLAIAVFLVISFEGLALAQEPGDATVMSSGYRPIPDGARLTLQVADDSDINLRLRDVAERALIRAGYAIDAENPHFTLRLETSRLLGDSRVDSSIGSLRAGSGVGRPIGNASGPQEEGVDVKMKLWSSTRNSLLSPRSSEVTPKQGFGVTITAFDEVVQKPAWHGIARALDSGGDTYRAGSAMVRHLVDALGLTVEEETISLR